MSCTQVVDSDDDADKSMATSIPGASKGKRQHHRQTRHPPQATSNDLTSIHSEPDKDSPEIVQEKKKVATSTSTEVSDCDLILLRLGTDNHT